MHSHSVSDFTQFLPAWLAFLYILYVCVYVCPCIVYCSSCMFVRAVFVDTEREYGVCAYQYMGDRLSDFVFWTSGLSTLFFFFFQFSLFPLQIAVPLLEVSRLFSPPWVVETLWLWSMAVKRAAAKWLSTSPRGNADTALSLTLLGYICRIWGTGEMGETGETGGNGGKGGGNAIMTQVEAAWNSNAIIMILRGCLHKCLVSGDTEGRSRALAWTGSFF